MTRVEPEETQDDVQETLVISQEEAEEMGFVPICVSSATMKSSRANSH